LIDGQPFSSGRTDAPGKSTTLDAFEIDLNWRMAVLEDEDLKLLWEFL
jgi:hypothetical protein